jgi:antitoxin MazE
MRTALRKMGNSAGMIVPKAILGEIGSEIGEEFDIAVEGGRIVAAPVRAGLRAGWADAARALAEAGDDATVWPDLGNDGDEALAW